MISGDISRVSIAIAHGRGLITLLITTHEPPSRTVPSLMRRVRSRILGQDSYTGTARKCLHYCLVDPGTKSPQTLCAARPPEVLLPGYQTP